jgi:hypothetical protein
MRKAANDSTGKFPDATTNGEGEKMSPEEIKKWLDEN